MTTDVSNTTNADFNLSRSIHSEQVDNKKVENNGRVYEWIRNHTGIITIVSIVALIVIAIVAIAILITIPTNTCAYIVAGVVCVVVLPCSIFVYYLLEKEEESKTKIHKQYMELSKKYLSALKIRGEVLSDVNKLLADCIEFEAVYLQAQTVEVAKQEEELRILKEKIQLLNTKYATIKSMLSFSNTSEARPSAKPIATRQQTTSNNPYLEELKKEVMASRQMQIEAKAILERADSDCKLAQDEFELFKQQYKL